MKSTRDRILQALLRQPRRTINELAETVEINPISGSRNDFVIEVTETEKLPTLQIIHQRPDDAFAAVPYRQAWYWIDDRDFASKRLFSFIMFLFTLTDTGEKQGAPIITVPVG